jgi:hypothetical protein
MLTVSCQPWADSAPTGYNLADVWHYATTVARWPEYLTQYSIEWHPHLEAIRRAIVERKVWAGGDWHQYSAHGIPVVDGGHFMSCTWRDWGELLAAIWNSELVECYTYMDLYIENRLPPQPWAATLSKP